MTLISRPYGNCRLEIHSNNIKFPTWQYGRSIYPNRGAFYVQAVYLPVIKRDGDYQEYGK